MSPRFAKSPNPLTESPRGARSKPNGPRAFRLARGRELRRTILREPISRKATHLTSRTAPFAALVAIDA